MILELEPHEEVAAARILWTLYIRGDWIGAAGLCRDLNAGLWDLLGVTCNVKVTA